ncbi:hypothetical protein R5H30_11390 [Sulfitobacter sp. D35]|uniref:hypothetical protein n=1 Tax=Sulfitobacter sp. D35 TaxID=3083252 RepID=UPI00296F02B7|nr:hypothetical protein [Sulfitobacter sp. D35]MDW4498588.1 hypothetical protein [Sulfitobacter sp. D35]
MPDEFKFNAEENWGKLTKFAIQEVEGWNQGRHSADPSGDGLGREERVGLPNIFPDGDLTDTYLFVADQIGFYDL